MKIYPDKENYTRLSAKYRFVPVTAEISGDIDTPVSIFLKLRSNQKYAFLLESTLQTEFSGRYSFIGIDPKKVIKFNDKKLTVIENEQERQIDTDYSEYLNTIIKEYDFKDFTYIPPFAGGLVGYFSYEMIKHFEPGLKCSPSNDETDDFELILADKLIAYDHYKHTIIIINTADSENDNSYEKAVSELNILVKKISSNVISEKHFSIDGIKGNSIIKKTLDKKEFESMVETAKEHIYAGDVFQIVMSQEFKLEITCEPFSIYRELRKINPSPYMFYLDFNGKIITGSSPEVLVKCIDGTAHSRPLAGTRKRGNTLEEDKVLIHDLLSDEKECAEHVMLVDLGRNDLGKHCSYGSIKVPEFLEVEKYSHVMHIVSEVTGKLSPDNTPFDLLKGCFPAGTVSGAPKIRAMELINKYEKTSRGIYAGAVGYFDFQGNMDTCIAIRTMFIKDGIVSIRAGAGIVADSIPENEYIETINKASALFMAVSNAEGKNYDLDN